MLLLLLEQADRLKHEFVLSVLVAVIASLSATQLHSYFLSSYKNRDIPSLLLPIAFLKRRIKAWLFLIRGPDIIQNAYDKANGAPFWLEVPENRYLVVSSWDHIREMDKAPDAVLSLQAAAKEILQPQYTMQSFNWFNKRGTDGTPLVRTLRTLLTNHLPELLPNIRCSMSALFDRVVDSHPAVNNVKVVPLYPMIIEAIAQTNATAFFGGGLVSNQSFMAAALDFIEQTLLIAEVVRVLPSSIAPYVGRFMANRLNSGKVLFATLVPLVQERLEERNRQRLGQPVVEKKDCIQWVMESSPRSKPWTAERIVHELIALWFGSVHITSTTACFALHDLCLHPEYVEPLRSEIKRVGWPEFDRSGGKAFPLLDSFMKESARITPVESVGSRRMALQPFELSDGSRVEVGEWICTAPRGMMSNPNNYTDATEFHGFRFVDESVLNQIFETRPGGIRLPQPQTPPSKFTDIDDWQLWGTGRCACPGRFYAAAVTKTLLSLFVTKYDMELADPKASRYFAWRTFIYPYSSTKVVLSARADPSI